jgi:hypothetical protein
VPLLVVLVALGSLLGPPPPAAPRHDLVVAAHVLHGWDARREAAWAAADPVALRSLYTRGSQAGAADVRLLRAYLVRGHVVRHIVTQVFALRVLHHDRTHVSLRVVDRVAGGLVADGTRTRQLGTTTPVVRVVELRLVTGVWKVEEVSARARVPRRAPP